ncbi:MAG: hypothetical protein JSR58_08290 [Verrucomicrobia bacterium]|nr:hypothetical protein [Verrucomicrobiota bacterium]
MAITNCLDAIEERATRMTYGVLEAQTLIDHSFGGPKEHWIKSQCLQRIAEVGMTLFSGCVVVPLQVTVGVLYGGASILTAGTVPHINRMFHHLLGDKLFADTYYYLLKAIYPEAPIQFQTTPGEKAPPGGLLVFHTMRVLQQCFILIDEGTPWWSKPIVLRIFSFFGGLLLATLSIVEGIAGLVIGGASLIVGGRSAHLNAHAYQELQGITASLYYLFYTLIKTVNPRAEIDMAKLTNKEAVMNNYIPLLLI